MIFIKQSNGWSCTACAFAMACYITLEEFIEKVGHDGSEIMFSDLPEPLCRKGFPFPECIQVCLRLDLTVTPIDFKPKCTSDDTHSYELDHTDFANQMMREYQGVISGMGVRIHHTVAWDGKQIYDPGIGVCDLHTSYFKPKMFWLIK